MIGGKDLRLTRKPIIRVDIDGTLTKEFLTWDFQNRSENKKAIKRVNALYHSKKFIIIIWTTRLKEWRSLTVGWLKRHGVKYHKLEMEKPPFSLLIDDRTSVEVPTVKECLKRPFMEIGGVE